MREFGVILVMVLLLPAGLAESGERQSVAALTCVPMAVQVVGSRILVSDTCGAVLELDKELSAAQAVRTAFTEKVYDIHFSGVDVLGLIRGRSLLSTTGTRRVKIAKPSGDAPFCKVALWRDSIIASNSYAAHLLEAYSSSGEHSRSLVANPHFDPHRTEVLTKFIDLIPLESELLAFDSTDFSLYRIGSDWNVNSVRMEPHRDHLAFVDSDAYARLTAPIESDPAAVVSGEEATRTFGGTFHAISTCACAGTLYSLMVARDGSGGKEIAWAEIGNRRWQGGLPVGGAPFRIACDAEWLYILDWKAKTLERRARPRV